MTTYYIGGAGHRNIYLWSHKLRNAFLSYSVQAAITKYHRLGALLIATLFFTVLEDGKSKIEVSADSGLLRVSFLVHKWYLLSLQGGRVKRALWGIFYKGPIPIIRVPSSWYNHLPKTPLFFFLILYPERDQHWIFTGRTDAESEPLVSVATWWEELTHWKIPDVGKDWRQKEKRRAEDEMIREHYWLNEHEFEQTPKEWRTGKPNVLQSMGSQRIGHDLVTEHQHTHKLVAEVSFVLIFLNLFIYLFWLHWVFTAAWALSAFVASRDYSLAVGPGLLIVLSSLVMLHGPYAPAW